MNQENFEVINNAVLSNVKNDTLYFGSAMVLAQLFVGRSLLSREWQIASLLTLVGFVAYQILVAQLVDSSKFSAGRVKALVDDVLKFGTMLVVKQLLRGGSLTDQQWLKESSYYLIGFAVYDLGVYYVYNPTTSDVRMTAAVHDVLKYGTALTTLQWLSGKEFNKEWALETTGYLAGLVAYEYLFMNAPNVY